MTKMIDLDSSYDQLANINALVGFSISGYPGRYRLTEFDE